jgi:hypothetical protein
MLTGCSPVFLLGLLGVSLGSWFFGTHLAARITGLILLMGFLLYFGLLNWTAQSNIRMKKEHQDDSGPHQESSDPIHGDENQIPFTDEDRAEWHNYLRSEGRLLWAGLVFLAFITAYLIIK